MINAHQTTDFTILFTLSAAVALQASADVVSSDVVGYTTIEVNKQYSILAVNFQSVSGGEISIQAALPYTEGMTQGSDTSEADNIQIMQDDGTYKMYYMSNGKVGKATYDTVGKWVRSDAKTEVTSDTIKSGTAFWYVTPAAPTAPYNIVVAGKVMSAAADTKDIAQKYMLVGNPYPSDVALNDGVIITEGASQGSDTSEADNLQIMQSDGSYKMYYLSNGKVGKATYDTVGKWVSSDDKTVATTDAFPAGKGAWFVSQTGTAKIQFKNPIVTE